MRLLNRIIDKLQEAFPPNRIMLWLAGPIVAASAWISAVVTAHVPGVELPVGIVAGVIGAAVLIAITLIYKWFDQWQLGEQINFEADTEAALEEFIDGPEVQGFFEALAALTGVGQELADLRNRVGEGTVNDQQIMSLLGETGDAIAQFLHDHPVEAPPEPEGQVAVEEPTS